MCMLVYVYILLSNPGGVGAILRRMAVHNCAPDCKTFYYILRALPRETGSEERLLEVMKVNLPVYCNCDSEY